MKTGVLGYGIIGKATEKIIKSSFDVCVDIQGFDDFNCLFTCDIVFICLPTSTQKDIDKLCHYVKDLSLHSDCEIVIRSTVTPGTCDFLINKYTENCIVYWPEFLRETSWQTDIHYTPNYATYSNKLHNLVYIDKYFSCNELEIIKLMSNVWSCVQITFANQMNDLCINQGVDMKKIMNDMLDTRLTSYTEGGRPFGGKCLPKDLDFIIDEYKKLNIKESFFTATKKDNENF